MSRKQVWFGTINRMAWIPAPMPGVGRGLVNNRAGKTFLNGGRWQRSSATGSRGVKLVWPTMVGADVRAITSFLEGTWGFGPYYYSDPFAEGANVLPQWLAVPWLATDDAPRLYPEIPPTQVTTPANAWLHPTYGASYTDLLNEAGPLFRFPVPPNTVAQFGWKGTGTGIQANGVNRAPLSVTTNVLTNYTYTAPAAGGWVTVQAMDGASFTIYSMHLSFSPTPVTGNFVKGEGFTALELEDDPSITGYTAGDLDRQAVSANFVEVGAWE